MSRTHRLYSIGEVAAKLALPRWKLAYLIEKGAVPPPSQVVAGRRLFTQEDIARIERELAGSTSDMAE